MKFNVCSKCNSDNNVIKNVVIPVRSYDSWLKSILTKNELFYILICLDCGYSEMYCAKVVDKNVKKNIADII